MGSESKCKDKIYFSEYYVPGSPLSTSRVNSVIILSISDPVHCILGVLALNHQVGWLNTIRRCLSSLEHYCPPSPLSPDPPDHINQVENTTSWKGWQKLSHLMTYHITERGSSQYFFVQYHLFSSRFANGNNENDNSNRYYVAM